MARDCFAMLGLPRGRHRPDVVAERFLSRRGALLRQLDDPATYASACCELDELYVAYAALANEERQAAYLENDGEPRDANAALRALIAASLEDGLLRHSRRQLVLERARELGVSEFHAQLLIAEVQFDGVPVRAPLSHPARPRGFEADRARSSRIWARVAGVGVLAVAMFLLLVRLLDH